MAMMRRLQIIAHRGDGTQAPENTLKAFQRAVEAGADAVELDVHLSLDGVPVVHHNYHVDWRGRRWPIGELTWSQLGRMQVQGEPIPRLEEVLEWAGPAVWLNLEIKGGVAVYPGIASTINRLLKQTRMESGCVLTSFHYPTLQLLRDLNPRLRLGLLYLLPPEDLWRWAHQLQAEAIFPHRAQVTPELVEQSHRKSLSVYPWTVEDEGTAEQFVSWQIDGLITHNPAAMAALRERMMRPRSGD